MSAIFGLIGDSAEADLIAMGERLAHKGKDIEIWSPARNVYFGEVRYWPRNSSENPNTASSLHLDVDWTSVDPDFYVNAQARDEFRREVLSRHLADGPFQAPAKLDGMFAYAHWDSSRKLLILAVDRPGYERLYYTRTPHSLVFASDYKALLALPDVRIAPDANALQFAISTSMIKLDTTLASGIHRVPQSHSVCFSGKTEKADSYWRARVRPKQVSRSMASDELREVLTDQIRNSLIPYEEIALTLSGGLDSSVLLALIRHAHPNKPVSTYTIGFSYDDPEIIGARESAMYFDTNHTELIFQPISIIKDLPRLVWLAEELAGREEAILQYQVEQYLLDREEVVIAGHGADMVFAGMPRHRLVRMAEKVPFAKHSLTELYQQTQSGKLPKSWSGKLASWMLYRGRNFAPPRLKNSTAASQVMEPKTLDDFIEQTICEMPEFHSHSATHSLAPIEALIPFLSNSVLNHSLTLPSSLKSSLQKQKIVLRDALSPLLPGSIRKRRKSIQRIKHDRELTEVLDHMADDLLSRASIANRGLITEKYVSQVRKKRKSGVYSGDQLSRVWMLLVCEIWCRTFVDNRGREL